MTWLPKKELDQERIEIEINELEKRDLPLLHFEAMLVYVPERILWPANQNRLQRLTNAGALDERRVLRWLEMRLPDNVRGKLEAHLSTIGASPSAPRHSINRICCPVICDYQSPLRPGETLAGVRWVEVVARGPSAGVSSGFPDEWEPTLGNLAALAQSVARTRLRAEQPHWRLLNSLGARLASKDEFTRESRSLELGAWLAFAIWSLSMVLEFTVGATGQVEPDGHIRPIDDSTAKALGVLREAPAVDLLIASHRDSLSMLEVALGGLAVLPVHSLAESLVWLQRCSGRAESVGLGSSRNEPGSVKRQTRQWLESDEQVHEGAIEAQVERIDRLIDRYAERGKWEEVVRSLQRKADVLSGPRSRASILVEIAEIRIHHMSEDSAYVFDLYRQAKDLDPLNERAFIGYARQMLGRTGEKDPLPLLETARVKALEQGNVDSLVRLAEAFVELDRSSEGTIYAWKSVLAADPKHLRARDELYDACVRSVLHTAQAYPRHLVDSIEKYWHAQRFALPNRIDQSTGAVKLRSVAELMSECLYEYRRGAELTRDPYGFSTGTGTLTPGLCHDSPRERLLDIVIEAWGCVLATDADNSEIWDRVKDVVAEAHRWAPARALRSAWRRVIEFVERTCMSQHLIALADRLNCDVECDNGFSVKGAFQSAMRCVELWAPIAKEYVRVGRRDSAIELVSTGRSRNSDADPGLSPRDVFCVMSGYDHGVIRSEPMSTEPTSAPWFAQDMGPFSRYDDFIEFCESEKAYDVAAAAMMQRWQFAMPGERPFSRRDVAEYYEHKVGDFGSASTIYLDLLREDKTDDASLANCARILACDLSSFSEAARHLYERVSALAVEVAGPELGPILSLLVARRQFLRALDLPVVIPTLQQCWFEFVAASWMLERRLYAEAGERDPLAMFADVIFEVARLDEFAEVSHARLRQLAGRCKDLERDLADLLPDDVVGPMSLAGLVMISLFIRAVHRQLGLAVAVYASVSLVDFGLCLLDRNNASWVLDRTFNQIAQDTAVETPGDALLGETSESSEWPEWPEGFPARDLTPSGWIEICFVELARYESASRSGAAMMAAFVGNTASDRTRVLVERALSMAGKQQQ